MKVKYIIMKMIDDKMVTLRDVAEMGTRNVDFFEQMLYYAEGQMFLAGEKREKIMNKLKISYATYWSRVHYMEKKGILKKTSKGNYKLSANWVRVFDVDPKKK